jgi:hypothetical protein
MQNKLRQVTTRSTFRQDKTLIAQSIKPKFNDKSQIELARLQSDIYPVFELFVRSRNSEIHTPWVRYEDILGDESITKPVKLAMEGGIDGEKARLEIDRWVFMKIFGAGIGNDAAAVSKVKDILSSFKKLRSRDFQFGYRIVQENEQVNLLHKVYEAAHPAEAFSLTSNWIRPSKIYPYKLVEEVNDDKILKDDDEVFSWIQKVSMIAVDMPYESPLEECVLCSDGSATMIGSECAFASASLIVFPSSKMCEDKVISRPRRAFALEVCISMTFKIPV